MDLQNITQKVIQLTDRVGHFIRYERSRFAQSSVEYKGANDLVSYVDKESEKMIIDGLSKIMPEAGFITEEGLIDQNKEAEFKWVVDPLDGTTNFVHGLPAYAISIGLMQGNEVVAGVVYDVPTDEMFYTSKGQPSFMNGRPIRVAPSETIAQSIFATGFPYKAFDKIDHALEVFKDLISNSHGVRRWGSAAIDLVYVACGRFDGYYEFNINSWDIAAGTLIVQNAGGTVTDFQGDSQFVFKGQVLAANKVHQELLNIIDKYWNED